MTKNSRCRARIFITHSTQCAMSTAFSQRPNFCYSPKSMASNSPFLSPTKIFLHHFCHPRPPCPPQPPKVLHSLMFAVQVVGTYPNPLTQESKTIRSADYVEHTLLTCPHMPMQTPPDLI